jgi:hypothetical protein
MFPVAGRVVMVSCTSLVLHTGRRCGTWAPVLSLLRQLLKRMAPEACC